MSEVKPGFAAQIKSFPAAFWVANTMEIFERMSWYGWFTVMALYVTGSVETGGLGFSTETRGALQAIVPFFLYLFPVFTGALADRYGFKKTFITAYLVMIVSVLHARTVHDAPDVLRGVHVRGGRRGVVQAGGRDDRQGHRRLQLGHGIRRLLHDGQHRRFCRADRGRRRPR